MRLSSLVFLFQILIVNFGLAQITSDIIDAESLERLELNSTNHEFSPVFVDEAIAFVLFKQKNKKDSPRRGEKVFDIMLFESNGETRLFSQKINSDNIEGPFAFANAKMYLTKSNSIRKETKEKVVKLKIFESRVVNNEWQSPKLVQIPAGDFNYCHPTLNDAGNIMIFASDMIGGYGKMDLYITFLRDDAWSRPENLGPEINSAGNDWFPFFNNNSQLFFASDGWSQNGDLDLYQVPYKNDNFVGVIKLPEPINGNFDDFGLCVNRDGDEILFSSSRPGNGKDDIYRLRLRESINVESFSETVDFSVQLIDEQSNQILANKEIQIVPINLEDFGLEQFDREKILGGVKDVNSMSFNIKTDHQGKQAFTVETNTKYVLYIDIEGYKESRFIYDPLIDSKEWIISMQPNKKEVLTQTTSNKSENKKIIIPTMAGSKVVFENIYYKYNSAEIIPSAVGELEVLFNAMKARPDLRVELIAHSDSRGKGEYNLQLSAKRAEAAKRYLIDKGISTSRVLARGMGETQIRNHCLDGVSCSEAEHQYNRRTEVKILGAQN